MPITADEVPVPVRCHADTDQMRPTPGGRYCSACEHEVVDLSRLSEPEVRRLLVTSAQSRVCVSYQPTPDGTIVTRRDPRVPSRTLPREALLRQVRPGLLAASALLAGGCGPAYDLVPEAVRSELPDVAQAALEHPVDFAACAVDTACDASSFGQPSWVPLVGRPPMVTGLLVVPPLPPTAPEEALPGPCLHDGASGE